MASKESERLLLLEQEVRSVSQELAQCQADKEFVWSLWKRLQVASPDLTQAVSVVVEREKQKAEAKDRKVLEILQTKDAKIQELEKEVRSKQEEVSGLLQVQRAGEEERGMMKQQLAELRQRLAETNGRLKEWEEEGRKRMEEQQEERISARVKDCEEEWRRRMEEQNTTRVKELQEDLLRVRTLSSSLSVQLGEKEQQLQQLGRELQQLQTLYVQSVEHAGEQADLIQQLEGLNMDTQQILQSQEREHSTHSASYHKLYSELSVSYQALRLSQEQLRQAEASLTEQLHQRDQQLTQLQTQLQQLQQHTTQHTPTPQAVQQECDDAQVSSVSETRPPSSDAQSVQHTHQRSRSLSPRFSRAAEQKIQHLEDLLSLKTAENEELRRAHAKRHDRLRLIQTNYRAVREQLREAEDLQKPTKRAEPWQLRHEDSDAVWNELAFFKRENKKLLTERARLEEDLDVARVQLAMERAVAQELRVRPHQEPQQDPQMREEDQDGVRTSSSPVPPASLPVAQSIQKMKLLEKKAACLERELLKLTDDNQLLHEANGLLCKGRAELQDALLEARSRMEEAQSRAGAARDRLLAEGRDLQSRLEKSRRSEAAMRRALLRVRQEAGVLRAERDFHKKETRRGQARREYPLTRVISEWHGAQSSPAKDEWEDVSQDSESEDFLDSLESRPAAGPPAHRSQGPGFGALPLRGAIRPHLPAARPQSSALTASALQRDPARRRRRAKRQRVPHHRLACLQQQVAALQSASRAAQEERQQHGKTLEELETLRHALQASKQLAQKQACDLAVLQQQKAVLEVELEQWKKPRPPEGQQQPPSVTPCAPDLSLIKTLESETKQLSNKLKSSSTELNRMNSVIKGLRAELHDRDQRLRDLQDKASHSERDVQMKRQLVEDLRSRLKILQDSERSQRATIDDLDKKIKALNEEASNRKAFIESLKRRLNVSTQEKQQSESSSSKLREDLHRKEQKLAALHARLAQSEKSKAELEQTATEQMQMLTNQSTETLQTLQNQLQRAQHQHEQLCSVTRALAAQVDREGRQTRAELRKRRGERRRRKEGAGRGGVSKSSMVKAQSVAASILNVSENDLASILSTDQEEECDGEEDERFVERVEQILQQQVLSAGVLLELLLDKMKQNRVLMEELSTSREHEAS